jgi:hypothetical protein
MKAGIRSHFWSCVTSDLPAGKRFLALGWRHSEPFIQSFQEPIYHAAGCGYVFVDTIDFVLDVRADPFHSELVEEEGQCGRGVSRNVGVAIGRRKQVFQFHA